MNQSEAAWAEREAQRIALDLASGRRSRLVNHNPNVPSSVILERAAEIRHGVGAPLTSYLEDD